MTLSPYLSFDGNCAEAMAFYQGAIADGAGELTVKTHAEAPADMQVSPEWQGKVLHARFAFEGFVLMASDIPPDHRTAPNPMVNLSLQVDTAKHAEDVFARLSEGGTVFMPVQQTFWAKRFGMLRDRYGFSWMVSCEVP